MTPRRATPRSGSGWSIPSCSAPTAIAATPSSWSQRLRWRNLDAELVEVAAGAPIPDSLDVYLFGGGEDDPQLMASTRHARRRARRSTGRARSGAGDPRGVRGVPAHRPHATRLPTARSSTGSGSSTRSPAPAPTASSARSSSSPTGTAPAGSPGSRTTAAARGSARASSRSGASSPAAATATASTACSAERLVGTYLHGPVLPRNPALADLLLVVDRRPAGAARLDPRGPAPGGAPRRRLGDRPAPMVAGTPVGPRMTIRRSTTELGRGYAAMRRPDPRIAARIDAALGDAVTVVNVGAGTGSYEPGRPGRRSARAVDRDDRSAPAGFGAGDPRRGRAPPVRRRRLRRRPRRAHGAPLERPRVGTRRAPAGRAAPGRAHLGPRLPRRVLVHARLPARGRSARQCVHDARAHARPSGTVTGRDRADASRLQRRVLRRVLASPRGLLRSGGARRDLRLQPPRPGRGGAVPARSLRADLDSRRWHQRNAELLELDEIDLGYRLIVAG